MGHEIHLDEIHGKFMPHKILIPAILELYNTLLSFQVLKGYKDVYIGP